MLTRPLFSIIIDARQAGDLNATLGSIRGQIYGDWDVYVLTRSESTPSQTECTVSYITDNSLATVLGDFVVFAISGDLLSPRALYEFASAINASPSLEMIYADKDRITSDGRGSQPFFKPDWRSGLSRDLQLYRLSGVLSNNAGEGLLHAGTLL